MLFKESVKTVVVAVEVAFYVVTRFFGFLKCLNMTVLNYLPLHRKMTNIRQAKRNCALEPVSAKRYHQSKREAETF